MDIITRPLDRWPREFTPDETYIGGRKARPFKTSFDRTVRILKHELRELEATTVVLQVAVVTERDISVTTGLPRADARLQHPGVIVAADTKHGALKWACDACVKWTDNVHAIALTLERLRLADLYGVTSKGEQYTGWKMLPGPITATAKTMSIEEASRFVSGLTAGAFAPEQIIKHRTVWTSAYRDAADRAHPDRESGSAEVWGKLQDAKTLLDSLHQGRK
jgi:hypothetical protein